MFFWISPISLWVCLFFSFFWLLGPHAWHMSWIRATATAMPDLNCIWDLHHSSLLILNPLAMTGIEPASSWMARYHCFIFFSHCLNTCTNTENSKNNRTIFTILSPLKQSLPAFPETNTIKKSVYTVLVYVYTSTYMYVYL